MDKIAILINDNSSVSCASPSYLQGYDTAIDESSSLYFSTLSSDTMDQTLENEDATKLSEFNNESDFNNQTIANSNIDNKSDVGSSTITVSVTDERNCTKSVIGINFKRISLNDPIIEEEKENVELDDTNLIPEIKIAMEPVAGTSSSGIEMQEKNKRTTLSYEFRRNQTKSYNLLARKSLAPSALQKPVFIKPIPTRKTLLNQETVKPITIGKQSTTSTTRKEIPSTTLTDIDEEVGKSTSIIKKRRKSLIPASTTNRSRRSTRPNILSLSNRSPIMKMKRSPKVRKSLLPISMQNRKSNKTLITDTINSTVDVIRKIPENVVSNPSCDICHKTFRLKSTLIAHNKTYHSTETTSQSKFTCKYCDKNFAVMKAYENHLQTYCVRIPEKERRTLMMKQFNCNASTVNYVKPKNIQKSSINSKSLVDREESVQPTSSHQTPAKNVGHSGIDRTPGKAIRCPICHLIFTDVTAYMIHGNSHSDQMIE